MGLILESKPGFTWQQKYFCQFFDDIVVYSSEPPEEFLEEFPNATPETFHLYIVKTILMKLNDWGLRISLEKCAFLQPTIDFRKFTKNKERNTLIPKYSRQAA